MAAQAPVEGSTVEEARGAVGLQSAQLLMYAACVAALICTEGEPSLQNMGREFRGSSTHARGLQHSGSER